MISVAIYEMAVILLFLSIRALWPELFVAQRTAKAPVRINRRHKSGPVVPAHFVRHTRNADPARSAGVGMMIH
jgi:hypothetical protein